MSKEISFSENILSVLENEDKVVEISEDMRIKALNPLDRMLECAK
jgi:quinolinate synthase